MVVFFLKEIFGYWQRTHSWQNNHDCITEKTREKIVLFKFEFNFSIKVRLFLDRSCAILSSFKIVVIFNSTTAEIKTKSADVLLKMTTILEELIILDNK